MDGNKFTKEQAREFLKQEALNEIREVVDFTRFHTCVSCVISKYGLQSEAKKEGLFPGEECSNPDCKAILMDRVANFFDRHIE